MDSERGMAVRADSPVPMDDTHAEKEGTRAHGEGVAGTPVTPAATRGVQQVEGGTVAPGVGEAVMTRAEQIDALPEFGKVTGLVAVEAGKTLYLTPLRSGELAAAYFDEATPAVGATNT